LIALSSTFLSSLATGAFLFPVSFGGELSFAGFWPLVEDFDAFKSTTG